MPCGRCYAKHFPNNTHHPRVPVYQQNSVTMSLALRGVYLYFLNTSSNPSSRVLFASSYRKQFSRTIFRLHSTCTAKPYQLKPKSAPWKLGHIKSCRTSQIESYSVFSTAGGDDEEDCDLITSDDNPPFDDDDSEKKSDPTLTAELSSVGSSIEQNREELSTIYRTKDDGILIYPHKDKQTGRTEPQMEDSDSKSKDYDLQKLLHNIQKSREKAKRPVIERVTMMSVEELVDFLREKNAKDICVMELPSELDYVQYLVICSALGTGHLGRMANSLESELRRVRVGKDKRRVRVEGRDSNDWMAIHLGTMVVHFMLEETRERYELEKLWTLGEKYDDQCRSLHKLHSDED